MHITQALELGLQAVVVVNKIDRPSARPAYVVDKTFDLFCDLNANDMQSDFQVSCHDKLVLSALLTVVNTSLSHCVLRALHCCNDRSIVLCKCRLS
jgi:translation elongation factor EF-4